MLAVVLVIRVVGLILVIEMYARPLLHMMVWSSVLGAVFTVAGLWLSFRYDLTSGASIIMVSGIVFVLSLLVNRKIVRSRP